VAACIQEYQRVVVMTHDAIDDDERAISTA